MLLKDPLCLPIPHVRGGGVGDGSAGGLGLRLLLGVNSGFALDQGCGKLPQVGTRLFAGLQVSVGPRAS